MGDRPNPDDLLEQVEEEERRAKRGKLTVFFGAAPGVGKTYAMLEAARSERDQQRDVVVGVVDTHGRYDTAALLLGLELLPRRAIAYKGVTLEELDVDAALTRRPGVVLVDELAHTNAEGSRHPKRWQDVQELLQAGCDVYTTLNVQHIETLNDVVAQITGVVVRETVPDSVLDEAHEVRLVDLPPDELLERLHDGKVHVPEQARRAIDNFFKKGNLIALRELALRRTAERVDEQMRSYKRAKGIDKAWPVVERVLVCVSPSPASARLVRAARRMVAGLRAEWIALYVETPAALRLGADARERLAQNLRLAEQLGAEVVTLSGENAAEETLRYARARNVTKVVLGKPTHPRWLDLVKKPFLEEIVRGSHDVDVSVISGDGPDPIAGEDASSPRLPSPERGGMIAAPVATALATLVAWFTFGQSQLADVVMVYLLGIVLVSMRFGYGSSLFATVLSVVTLDFFFIPPYFSFAVSDLRHIGTFAVMFVVAVVISSLTRRVREQADTARSREQRTASLYAMTRELAGSRGIERLIDVASRHVAETFDAKVAILFPASTGKLEAMPGGASAFTPDEREVAVAQWVWTNGRVAGLATDTLPTSAGLYVPLQGSRERVGVLGVIPTATRRFVDPDQRQHLETFAAQVASALERVRLADDAQRAQVQMEGERLRSSLLSSVSHDLRTPLAVITGAASTLVQDGPVLGEATRTELSLTIQEEAQRLTRLVRNLLDMTRLAAGAIRVKKEWQPLEEIVGVALNRLDDRLAGRTVDIRLPNDLPPVPIDAVLVEQLMINLLENAAKYTPIGSPIEIRAVSRGPEVWVEVADRGPGIPRDEVERVFDKFYRLPHESAGGGAGLGLAICRGVVEAHGGKIWVDPREGGGAVFRFTLPVEGKPPTVPS